MKSSSAVLVVLSAALVSGCDKKLPPPPVEEEAAAPIGTIEPLAPARVLVVTNEASEDSKAIADYYVAKRAIPAQNRCAVRASADEEVALARFDAEVREPLRRCIADKKLDVDVIVLTRGIPIRTTEGPWGGFAGDALISAMELKDPKPMSENPYFQKHERFSHAKFGTYLVARLDGYTRADALALVDRSLAAKPLKGPFLLHQGSDRFESMNQIPNEAMERAAKDLGGKGFDVRYDKEHAFVGGYKHLMGYFSWGSNDSHYDAKAYHSLGFAPGALAETFVSTSGRTFQNRDAPGQSLVADLIEQGVTGVKGYASEPSVRSFALADVTLERYVEGYSAAEAFGMASRFIQYKDITLGDPLCAPYAKH